MVKAADAMGLGFSWPQAQAIGDTFKAITAAGSSSTDATVCDPQSTIFQMTASGSDGIRMNANVPVLSYIMVANTAAGNGKVYPHTGGTVNSGSTDAAEICNATTVQIWVRVSATGWVAVLGA